MENDERNSSMTDISSIKTDNIYRLDYINQNFKNSPKFQRWKASMLNKFGRNAILYKCKADKILFYA